MAERVITGTFQNGVIIPDKKVKIKNNQKVQIVIPTKSKKSTTVEQIAKEIRKLNLKLDHETIEQIIESTEYGEGID